VTQRVLGLFAKWPIPGTVKTRLTSDPVFGAAVARAFLLDTLSRLRAVDARRVLAYAPPGTATDFAALVPDSFLLTSQPDGDLGRRLALFFETQLNEGAPAVVAVGTDSPTLPVSYVERAFQELERAEVVLGPATDGGYYLIGCAGGVPSVFTDIPWGSSRVLAETIARLGDAGGRLAVLPPWYDVDTPEGWDMLCGHVAALRRAGVDPGVPHTEALVRELSR
jgi:rSAM/selenodomain-associated transferase 1